MHASSLMRRLFKPALPALVAGLALLASGCAMNPVTGRREMSFTSEARELQIGEQNYEPYQQMEGGEYVADPAVASYVRGVAQKIWSVSDRPDLPYEIVVLNNSVPNAWALPGGKMAINRGLLTELKTEAELAAVLGHETIHIAARHGARSMDRGLYLQGGMLGLSLLLGDSEYRDVGLATGGILGGLTALKYDRGAELQADKYGIAYMSRAGYDTQAAVSIQEMFLRFSGDKGWLAGILSTHPPSRERIEENRKTIEKYPKGGFVGRDEYQRAMAGLMKDKAAYDKLEQGQKALKNNNPASALAFAKAAIALQPKEGHFYSLAAKALAAQKNYTDALASADEAIRRNGEYYEYYLDRGRLRKRMGDMQAARSDLERSAALMPTDKAHYLLGMMDIDSGRPGQAREHFRAASMADSDDGRKAGVLLAKMEIADAPERYLQVGYHLDQRGFLVVTMQNRSPVDVGTCEIGLASAASGGRWVTHRFDGGVPAHRENRLVTNIGPFANPEAVRGAVRFRFENVSPDAQPSPMRRNRGR